ncbi:MAG: FCD domain-containing protein [Anaerolineales bacterium]|jgi:DNA-binding FadR family transcriptional regulator
MVAQEEKFDFLSYLVQQDLESGSDVGDIPPLTTLSKRTGVSVTSLREQLSVARAFGFVDVRPHRGIRRLPYRFTPAVQTSLSYAISLDRKNFDYFSDLRRHIEGNYWFEAVEKLTAVDKAQLVGFVQQAWEKLEGSPIRLPHFEHRQLHIIMYGRLENPFVSGILEAYWDAYEEVGLSRYTDLEYLKKVWHYHNEIVEAICQEDYKGGYQLLLDHMELINKLSQ